MAIFQTGAVTTIPNLLDVIAAFAVANGFTQNYNAVEGNGRRVHLQLGTDVFVNLRALVAELADGVNAAAVSGLALINSTGYNNAVAWAAQPGVPTETSGTRKKIVGMMGISGAMPAYYLFARGSMIYCWLEYATGQYQWLMFGKITKSSTWVGGSIFAAANNGYSNGISSYTTIANLYSQTNGSANPNAFMYGVIEGNTGWLPCDNTSINVAMPKFFDSIGLMGNQPSNLSNTYNGLPILAPIDIGITRDGTAARSTATNFSLEGKLPDIYLCNMRNLISAQQLNDGSGDTFRVFPFRQKSVSGLDNTGWHAVAIKEN